MPQYMLSVHHREDEDLQARDQAAMTQLHAQVQAFNEEVQQAGQWVFAGGLNPPETATVVEQRADGQTLMSDGPFIEAKEYLGGFWVLTAQDLDEAISIAKRASLACEAPVEVRPFQG